MIASGPPSLRFAIDVMAPAKMQLRSDEIPMSPASTSPSTHGIGLWSSDYSRITGQAIVTARAAALLRQTRGPEFVYGGKGLTMLLTWLRASALLWRLACFGHLGTLYLVCSRSTLGFLRDWPAYLVQLFGVKVVVHVHGSDIVDLLERRTVGAVARLMMRRCVLIVPSRHLVAPLRDLGMSRLRVCENFLIPRENSPSAEPRQPSSAGAPRALNVLWNSNVMASKGFFLVAAAVASLHRDGHAIRLVALGREMGDAQLNLYECRRQVAQLRAEPWFEYRGPVDPATASGLLAQSDVVCLPSTYASECQPLAVIEAMCSGRRLLIANTPALRATVEDYPCEVAEVVDADGVRAALNRLAQSNEHAEHLERAAVSARQRFSAVRFDRDLADIFGISVTTVEPTLRQS